MLGLAAAVGLGWDWVVVVGKAEDGFCCKRLWVKLRLGRPSLGEARAGGGCCRRESLGVGVSAPSLRKGLLPEDRHHHRGWGPLSSSLSLGKAGVEKGKDKELKIKGILMASAGVLALGLGVGVGTLVVDTKRL